MSELHSEPVKQIASVSSGTPNVLLEGQAFRFWVANNLTLAWQPAIDAHVVGEVQLADTTVSPGGANAFEDVLYAQEAVAAEGYAPSLVVVSPADALAIRLLQMASGVTYAFAQSPPEMIVSLSIDTGAGFVMDPAAAGTLYISPPRFGVFEESAGSTNSSTARFESHGTLVVQRPGAVALLAGGS